ncbi:Polyadenylate-binding protein-interacting protein 1 [Gryllus bimaculatus]|nr:Polyadenylate-binding protein-interacting protein 1 [Gryllus bimaculatus]
MVTKIGRNKSGTEQAMMPPPDPGAKGDSVVLPRASILSADAKEFVPKCYNAEQFEEAGGGGDAHADTYPIPEELTENFLSDVIHDLTLNPGHYNSSVSILTELLLRDLTNKDLHSRIIDIIVEKSITLPNFRYNGARLLCHFRSELPSNLQNDFRNLLLRRCQVENAALLTIPNVLKTQGFAMFLAELYIQMKVTVGNNDRIAILAAALFEVMKNLLTSESCENIKCVCQVLKLAGLALDEKDTRTMDAVVERLTEIQNSYEKENTVRLITSVIKLRQNAWRPPSLISSAVSACGMENEDMPQFFLPNGDTLSPEESRFLQDNIVPCEELDEYSEEGTENSPVPSNYEGEDTEDEEFDKAFEAFLAFSQQSKKSS